ncbi:MAG: hypothetical protein ABIK75_07065 [candidate division WOR-3 bacterium]
MGFWSKVAEVIEKVKKKDEKSDEDKNSVEEDFLTDIGSVLTDWGLSEKEALKVAKEIYDRYKEKIEESLTT